MDVGHPAVRVIGRFADGAQLVLGHSGPRVAPQSLDREIGERRRDTHPVDLLSRLHQPQAHVLAVEIDERTENGLELPAFREAEGAHQADAPRALRSAIALSIPRCSPQRTSVSRASLRASGQWLYHSMYMTCGSRGATIA